LPGRFSSQFAPSRSLTAARLLQDEACIGVVCFPFSRRRLVKIGVPEDKIRDCYPVVDVARFLDRAPNGDAVMNCGPALRKKAMADFISLAAAVPDRRFNLYAIDYTTNELEREAKRTAESVTIPGPIDHNDMPGEYKKHNRIVKTSDTRRRTMG